MLTLGLRYLNGWAMATHPADRERPEWPPHPDRVFMALAAACFETGGVEAEIQALEWLERQGAPRLLVAAVSFRAPVTTFVPVNDRPDPVKKDRVLPALGSLPIGRDRQPRQFAVAVPEDPVVHLLWPDAHPTAESRRDLGELCRKVTHVGHSASFVQIWVEEGEVAPGAGRRELVPVDGVSRYRLRVAGPGRLTTLRRDFAARQRPTPSRWRGYHPIEITPPEPDVPTSDFATDLLVLRGVKGSRLGLESTLQLAAALHKTTLKHCLDPPPEWISGHLPDGRPSERDHCAFLPLPHVGRQHADGHLLGLAIAVPVGISREELAAGLGPLLYDRRADDGLHEVELVLGRLGRWSLKLEDRDARARALEPESWTRSARRWGTVTPIALDRHPKGPDRWLQVEESIARGCQRIGLPAPQEVVAAPVSLFEGVPHARDFPKLHRKSDGGGVFHTHAVITFAEEVEGPLLVGAGRYRGYGFFRPLPTEGER